ncbi:MAG TPA: BrnA antitoxin family protein [Rhizomicrobium sp.]|nr:BrnA antitoxin family protein [Rhizomicrobium sp.]
MSERRRKSNHTSFREPRITAEEYAEMPEWTDEQLDRAEFAIGNLIIRPATGTLTKPGRPKIAAAKQSVHLRLSPDVLAWFRKTGPGWQTRIDDTLRKAAKLGPRKK